MMAKLENDPRLKNPGCTTAPKLQSINLETRLVAVHQNAVVYCYNR